MIHTPLGRLFTAASISLLAFTAPAFADLVYLRDGRVLEGKTRRSGQELILSLATRFLPLISG